MDEEGVGFDVTLPGKPEELRRNVEHALSLGLPDLPRAPRWAVSLNIIANGPSAESAPLWSPTLALNGAMGLFFNSGRVPTFWAACDPQEMVAGFLKDAPRETIYLICSACHAAVFEALKDRTVFLWHLDEECYWDLVSHRDPLMVGPTISIIAMELADRLGFGRMDYWGWDGCYIGQRDHAVPQVHKSEMLLNEVDGELFATTASWMWESHNAVKRLAVTPRDITVHGPGMIGALLRAHGVVPKLEVAA